MSWGGNEREIRLSQIEKSWLEGLGQRCGAMIEEAQALVQQAKKLDAGGMAMLCEEHGLDAETARLEGESLFGMPLPCACGCSEHASDADCNLACECTCGPPAP